ncbi:MAG: MBL fold metallo-hydrolase [Vicinamibacteria bacterium]
MRRRFLVLTTALLSAGACGNREGAQVQNRGEGKEEWWEALPRPAWNEFRKVGESQGWFEIYEIRPGIFALYEPGQFEEAISYLILGSEGALLFDTGLGIGNMRSAVETLTDREPIVLNSHTHYDHVGGNHLFENVYATGTDYTKKNSGGRPHEQVAEFVSEGWIWKETPESFSRDAYRGEPFEIRKTIEDQDVVDLGDRKLEILLTPGHAPDALCLLDRENRLLFTGDTFYPAALYAHLPGSDLEAYRKTAARLAELRDQVDFVLPAHNEPLVSSEYLTRMRDAFEAIAASRADFVLTDGNREYAFEGFSILTPNPPS